MNELKFVVPRQAAATAATAFRIGNCLGEVFTKLLKNIINTQKITTTRNDEHTNTHKLEQMVEKNFFGFCL